MKCCFKHFISILFFLIFFSVLIQAQENFSSEEELKKYARELFDNEDYQKALPLYSQLLSLYPKDPNYNYRYGTCLLFGDTDKEKPLKYLQFASSKEGVEPEVFFYLGKAFHLNYRFDEAIEAYTKFEEKGSGKSKSVLRADRQMEMCNNGKMLIRNITDLVVIEKKEIKETDFFRSYSLGNFGGKIIVKPDEFKTPVDIKKKEKSILFLPDSPNEIYFASYGENDKNGKDIFKVNKLPNGEWSKPVSLGPIINTPYDEDYPFLHPNGNALYFCSKGHNSMGGYDIFKSTLNTNNNTWGEPVNLDFAINSPDDDILFITDADEETAYFSSGRASIEGNTSVYKIKIDRKPLEYALIKGKFIANANTANTKITVRNLGSNEVVGISEPNAATGNYLLSLKKGGKYKFIIESEGSPTQSGVVEIPTQEDKNVLKQEMELVDNGSGAKLIIRNLFDEEVADTEPVPLDFIKKQASLDVNYDPEEEARKEALAAANNINNESSSEDTKSNNTTNEDNTTDKEVANNNISDKEIITIAYKDAENIDKEAEDLKNEADFIYSFAENKSEEAKEKLRESENTFATSGNIEDPKQREAELEKAKQLKKQSDQLAREAVVSYNLAQKLENDANKKGEEAQQSLQYAKELESAVNSNSSKETLNKLNEQKEKLEKSSINAGSAEAVNTLKKQSVEKLKEAEKAREKAQGLQEELSEINTEMATLKAEAEKTKDKALKEELNNQVNELQIDYNDVEIKSKNQLEKANQLEKEANRLQNDALLATDLIDEIKTTAEKEPASTLTAQQKDELKARINELETQSKDAGKEELISSNNNKETIVDNQFPDKNELSDNTEEETNESEEIAIVNENGELYDYGSLYMDQLDKVELIDNEYSKEKGKEEIYNNWASSISKEITFRKDKLKSLDKKERKAEEQKITALENLAITKRVESDKSLAKAEEIKNNETALNKKEVNSSDENLADNTVENNNDNVDTNENNITSENVGEIDYNNTEEESTETNETTNTTETSETADTIDPENNTGNKSSENSIKNKELENFLNTPPAVNERTKQYSSDAANAERINAENIYKEAEELSKEATQKRVSASNVEDLEQRKLLLEEAVDLDTQSQEKKIEAALTYAKANQAEFLIKESELSRLARTNKDKRSDELSIAGMLREEAQYYFNEAKNIRENSNSENPISRLNALNKANEYEIIAIDKQQKASEIHARFAPAIANSDSNNNTAETTAQLTTEKVDDNNSIESNANANSNTDSEKTSNIVKKETLTEEQKQEIARLDQLAKEEIEKSEQLRQEYQDLMVEVNQLKEQADNTKKKKEKADLLEQARVKNEEAIAKQNDAAIADQKAEKLKEESEAIALSKSNDDNLALNSNNNDLTIEEKIAIETNRNKETNSNTETSENTETNNDTETNRNTEVSENTDTNNDTETNRNTEISENTETNNETIIKENTESTEEKKEIERLTQQVKEEKENAEKIQEEAQALAEESSALTTQAENTKKKKEKAELLEQARIKNEASIAKQLEAETAYENVEKLEDELNALLVKQANALEIANNPDNRSNENTNEENNTTEITETTSPINDTERIKNSEEYKNYNQLKEEAANKKKLSEEEFAKAEKFKSDGESQLSLAQGLKENAEGIDNEEEKEEALLKAKEYDKLGNVNLLKADSIIKIAKNYEAEAGSGEVEADQYLQSLDRETYQEIIALNNNNGDIVRNNDNTNLTNNNETNPQNNNTENTTGNKASATPKKYEIPEVLTEEIFETTPTVVYNASNPIPLNSKLPEGLVFKVQVGAFRNPIPQDLFKGFAPILGESTPQGFTRYTAGIFKSLETANLAKEVIRGYGYRDAFVVAFYNGKRISYQEAQALIKKGQTPSGTGNNIALNNNSDTPVNNNTNNENTVSNKTPVTNPASGTAIATFEELTDVKGLLYTVQVGVYSKAVTSSQLFNIQPLFVEKTANGFLRYTSGIYDNIARANEARNTIAGIGVKDAFVTVYYNGKRISAAEATAIEGANGKGVFVQSPNLNKLPTTGSGAAIASFNKEAVSVEPDKNVPDKPNNTNTNNTTDNSSNNSTTGNSTNLVTKPANNNTNTTDKPVFKVQIGAFKEEVPIEIASIYLKIASRGIAHYVNEDGLTVYTLGAFPDIESANTLKTDLKNNQGLVDAFVVAYLNDKKIPLDEALQLLNE